MESQFHSFEPEPICSSSSLLQKRTSYQTFTDEDLFDEESVELVQKGESEDGSPQSAHKKGNFILSTTSLKETEKDTAPATYFDQDFMQRLSVVCIVPLELYKVLISSLLILFVPQSCDGELCSMKENMESDNIIYTAGLVINFFTLFVFVVMYIAEVIREEQMVQYLQVNKDAKNSNGAVGESLSRLADDKKRHICDAIQAYKYIGGFAIIMYITNGVISGIIIANYILGDQTMTVFITNLLFMVMKLADVYSTISQEPNVFLSAYMKVKVQFNDVDPDHLKTA